MTTKLMDGTADEGQNTNENTNPEENAVLQKVLEPLFTEFRLMRESVVQFIKIMWILKLQYQNRRTR